MKSNVIIIIIVFISIYQVTLHRNVSSVVIVTTQGRSDGGYIGIYPPKSVCLKFFYLVVLSPWPRTNWNCNDWLTFIPTDIKFLATPL